MESMDTGPYILVGILVLAVILVVGIVRLIKKKLIRGNFLESKELL